MTGTHPLVGVFAPAGPADMIALTAHDGQFIAAFEREARRRGHRLLLTGVARPADVRTLAEGVSGAVLLGFRDDELEALAPLPLPAVALDSYARHPALLIVRTDDEDGGRQAGAHLVGRGHRRILFVGPADDTSGVVRERHRGFRAALAARGVEPPARHVTSGTSVREGVAIGRTLGRRHPEITAVFATADTLAIGLLEGLALDDRSVPRDVSVMGFDNLELASAVTPRLSTVAQDIARKAHLAADALLGGGMRDGVAGPLSVGVVIIERASVGAPR